MIILQDYETSTYLSKIKNYFYENKSLLILEDEFINYLIKYYKVKFYFIISLTEDKNINGILFFYLNSNSKKKIANTFFDSFFFNNQKVANDIILKAKNFIDKNFINSFKINSRKSINSTLTISKKNYIIPIIENNINENWINKPGVFRTEVRKAKKRGFTVSCISNIHEKSYYNLYLENQLKKKIPLHNEDVFFKLLNMNNSIVFSCEKNHYLSAFALIYVVNNDAHLMFLNISYQSLSHGVNQSIIWEIIKYLSKKKVKNLILGTSQQDGSTAFFKKKVGGEDLNYYQHEIVEKKKNLNNKAYKLNLIYNIKSIIINFLPKFLLIYFLKKKRFNDKIF